jgi:hypothetical protein
MIEVELLPEEVNMMIKEYLEEKHDIVPITITILPITGIFKGDKFTQYSIKAAGIKRKICSGHS